MQSLHGSRDDSISSLGSTPYLTKACQADDPESHYLELPNSEKGDLQIEKFIISDCLPFSPSTDVKLPSLYLPSSTQEGQVTSLNEEVTLHLSNGQLEHQKDVLSLDSTHKKCTQIENVKGKSSLNGNGHNEHKQETHNCKDKDTTRTHERTGCRSNLTDNLIMPLFPICKEQASVVYPSPSNSHSQFTEQRVTTEHKNDSSSFSHHGIVVAIDNSNIYIGAQECASMVNAGDRKRHVRVKLQNLVRILERERTKTRGFACGSSPPATEHVWEVYRYI